MVQHHRKTNFVVVACEDVLCLVQKRRLKVATQAQHLAQAVTLGCQQLPVNLLQKDPA